MSKCITLLQSCKRTLTCSAIFLFFLFFFFHFESLLTVISYFTPSSLLHHKFSTLSQNCKCVLVLSVTFLFFFFLLVVRLMNSKVSAACITSQIQHIIRAVSVCWSFLWSLLLSSFSLCFHSEVDKQQDAITPIFKEHLIYNWRLTTNRSLKALPLTSSPFLLHYSAHMWLSRRLG